MSRGAIILCGGASSRMGRDKALLPFGPDEVLLQRVVRLVGQVVANESMVCVAAAGQELPKLPEGVTVVRDRERHAGPLAGLAAGLSAVAGRASVVFATGCDAPLLQPALVSRLFDMLGENDVAAPHEGGHFHPLPAVYRTDLQPICVSLLAAGERSLVSLIERCRTLRVPAEALRDVDPELASLASCNTDEDYRRSLTVAGFGT
jgi:molybdopterin-guanine dinucleotide biosynthesis protein A